jgi:uncharacterized protein (TIGR02421 family)
VYRRPPRRADRDTEILIIAQSAYCVAVGNKAHHAGLSSLVGQIVQTQAEICGGFLLIEVWASTRPMPADDPELATPPPAFRILTPRDNRPERTIKALKNALLSVRVNGHSAEVHTLTAHKVAPPGMESLLTTEQAQELGCHVLGLEVRPIYRNPETGAAFPLVRRAMLYQITGALQQSAFAFAQQQTNFRALHYLALGRRRLVPAVWEVDRQLAEVGSDFDFLLQSTPTNGQRAWNAFKRGGYDIVPEFHYRPLKTDPALQKRRLWKIPIEDLEDPAIARVFREKRNELDIQLTMMSNFETPAYLYGGIQLYGDIDDDLYALARKILETLPPRSRDDAGGGHLGAVEFADMAREELAFYRQQYPKLKSHVEVRDDIIGLMVSRGNLLVGTDARIPTMRAEALLNHEVGTHIVTYFNGRAQPFQQLYLGLADYDELQEGLAVLAEFLVDGLSRPRLRLLAARVIAARCLIDGASFIDTFRLLADTYGFQRRLAFTITKRIYRGGGLIKDAIYLRGLVSVLDYLASGGALDPLFVGKIAVHHIPLIEELRLRQVLHDVPLRPRYMDRPGIEDKLVMLRSGLSVLDLIERQKR